MPFAWLSPVSGRWLQQPSTAAPSDPVLERQVRPKAATPSPRRHLHLIDQPSVHGNTLQNSCPGKLDLAAVPPSCLSPPRRTLTARTSPAPARQHAPASPRPSSYGKTLRIGHLKSSNLPVVRLRMARRTAVRRTAKRSNIIKRLY
ncbi:hypothetical protein C8T65DRAFT_748849 [Cerioporus squamosus]|nr:hypothetical protein C8T65DRAFT_748849 [Cerioporus squamosus]